MDTASCSCLHSPQVPRVWEPEPSTGATSMSGAFYHHLVAVVRIHVPDKYLLLSFNWCPAHFVVQSVVTGFQPQWTRFNARSGHMWFVMDKWHWSRFHLITSVSPACYHFTACFIFIYHQGWYNVPTSTWPTKWTQFRTTQGIKKSYFYTVHFFIGRLHPWFHWAVHHLQGIAKSDSDHSYPIEWVSPHFSPV